jgi:Na+/proline symporter
MPLVLALVGYVALNLAIGLWASRRTRGEADYLVAGRTLGLFAVSMSVFATWFGGETVLASTGIIAAEGISGARAEPVGYALCLILAALLVAGALRRAGYMTLADFFRDRFGPRAEVAAALVSIPTSVIWGAAQLLALGTILSAVTDLPLEWTLIGVTALVLVYTLLGGLLASVATDLVQGTVILGGLFLLLFALLERAGGVGGALSLIEPEQLRIVAPGESGWARLDAFAIPILGSIVAQELLTRFMGARTAQVAVRGGLFAGALYLAVGVIPLTLGLVGPGLGFDREAGDFFLPTLAAELLPSGLFVVFLGALFSAVLSTVDSALLASSALATRNLYLRLHPEASDGARLRAARGLTLLAGISAYGIARSGDTIYGLVELASSLGSAGLLVALVVGIHSRMGGEGAALLALAGGLLGMGVAEWVLALQAPFMFSIAMALVGYGIGAAWKARRLGTAVGLPVVVVLVAALAAIGVMPGSLEAQAETRSPRAVTGTVVDNSTMRPISQAAVRLRTAEGDQVLGGTFSDAQGRFTVLFFLPDGEDPGPVVIEAGTFGFVRHESEPFTLEPRGATVHPVIRLRPEAVRLDTLVVFSTRPWWQLPPPREIVRRRQLEGKGTFFPGAIIAAAEERDLPSILEARIPGLRVLETPTAIVLRSLYYPYCIHMLVNEWPASGSFRLDAVRKDQVGAVEVYNEWADVPNDLKVRVLQLAPSDAPWDSVECTVVNVWLWNAWNEGNRPPGGG